MIATLTAIGGVVPFDEIAFGEPFLHAGRFWVRTDHEVGTDIGRDEASMGSCSFLITEQMVECGTSSEEPGWTMVQRVEVRLGQG